jgi:hypothetical protein
MVCDYLELFVNSSKFNFSEKQTDSSVDIF